MNSLYGDWYVENGSSLLLKPSILTVLPLPLLPVTFQLLQMLLLWRQSWLLPTICTLARVLAMMARRRTSLGRLLLLRSPLALSRGLGLC